MSDGFQPAVTVVDYTHCNGKLVGDTVLGTRLEMTIPLLDKRHTEIERKRDRVLDLETKQGHIRLDGYSYGYECC